MSSKHIDGSIVCNQYFKLALISIASPMRQVTAADLVDDTFLMSAVEELMSDDVLKAFVFAVAVPFSVISCIVCIIPLIALVRKPSILTQHILKSVLTLTYGSIGCYALSMIFFTLGNILLITLHSIGFIVIGCFTVFYVISQVLIYSLLMFRVYHTFKDTEYMLSRCTLIFFAVMVIAFFICSIFGIVYNYLLLITDPDIPEVVLDHFGVGIAFSREIIDALITVYLVSLFIKQLLNVTVDINDHNIDTQCLESGLIIQLDESQNTLLRVTTRFFVLALLATLSTQLNLIIGTISLLGQYFDAYHVFISAFALHWWLIPIDCMINSICLYLMLEANNEHYVRICARCDGRSRVCCQRIAKKLIKRSYESVQNGGTQMDVKLLDESDI